MEYKCSCHECQFDNFLISKKNHKVYYFEDEENFDLFCIFHAPQKIKKNFRVSQKSLFDNIIEEYINCKKNDNRNINFDNSIFLKYNFSNLKLKNLNLSFNNTIFLEYVRFDNIKCNILDFRDTTFYNGGGIKNRSEDENLNIKNLNFRPEILESDFVIDIGKYANNSGLQTNKIGIIKNIKFENHKVGNGKVFL